MCLESPDQVSTGAGEVNRAPTANAVTNSNDSVSANIAINNNINSSASLEPRPTSLNCSSSFLIPTSPASLEPERPASLDSRSSTTFTKNVTTNTLHNTNGITILQWNAFSLVAHNAEFRHYLEGLRVTPDVICIQETFYKPDKQYPLLG